MPVTTEYTCMYIYILDPLNSGRVTLQQEKKKKHVPLPSHFSRLYITTTSARPHTNHKNANMTASGPTLQASAPHNSAKWENAPAACTYNCSNTAVKKVQKPRGCVAWHQRKVPPTANIDILALTPAVTLLLQGKKHTLFHPPMWFCCVNT